MGILTKAHIPLVSGPKFNVPPGAAIAAGTGAYGTATNAGNGCWVLGSALPKGRKIQVILNTGAIANAPTAVKVSLFGSATDANGTSGAEIAATVNEVASSPAGHIAYQFEIDLANVTDLTKYYSLGISVNGAGATSTMYASATAEVLDPTFVP